MCRFPASISRGSNLADLKGNPPIRMVNRNFQEILMKADYGAHFEKPRS